MAEICQTFLDGFVMPAELTLSILVPIFKEMQLLFRCEAYVAWYEGGEKGVGKKAS